MKETTMDEYTPVWMEKNKTRKQALTAEVKALLESQGWKESKPAKPEKESK